MTDQEITKRAASILGWTAGDAWWRDSDGRLVMGLEAFDPLHDWWAAGLLVEKMREMPELVQFRYAGHIRKGFNNANVGGVPNGCHMLTWLTPAAITRAAVEACGKEKDATDR